ncbi:MAG: hypothetical protein NT099_04870 [Candidatus Saganbacteria bacterium]|nr:hypothetical protein [Candidatus Saganbacteria bacterium]
MAEEKKDSVTLEGLLKQIDEFQATISGLANNVGSLKKKLLDKKQKFGSDITKWPKEE